MEQRNEYFEELIKTLMGPVAPYYEGRGGVSEIMINGPEDIYVETENGICRAGTENGGEGCVFKDAAQLRSLARAILQFSGKTLSPLELSQEARLPDKSRVHIVQDPAASGGLSITIRRFSEKELTLDNLYTAENTSLTEASLAYLKAAVSGRANIVVAGGTGSGKTTFLNALGAEIDLSERIVTIEDVTEIKLPQDRNVVTLETQAPDAKGRGGIGIRGLFKAALRMRPDRILIGECRGGEALDMIQAMNSGHAGSLSTVHAETPERALSRLETLCLMGETDIPIIAVRRQLLETVNVIIQLKRLKIVVTEGVEKDVRVVTHIAEVTGETPGALGSVSYAAAIKPVFELRENRLWDLR
ncbi:MAG: ATPase, T2SS/T4P/T4SS family [Roseobacter sp.]